MTSLVVAAPLYFASAIGKVLNYSRVSALGHNGTVPNTGADVWEGGGFYPFPTVAQTLEVLSANAGDIAITGAGAHTALISGLNSSYAATSETIALNGITPVPTINSYLRVNLFTVTSSGSNHMNLGDITLRVAGAGATLSIARAGYGFGRSCIYTVPANYQLFIASIYFSIVPPSGVTTNSCVCAILQQSPNGNQRITTDFNITSTTPYRHEAAVGIVINPETDFAIRVTSTAQSGTSNVTAAMEGVLLPYP